MVVLYFNFFFYLLKFGNSWRISILKTKHGLSKHLVLLLKGNASTKKKYNLLKLKMSKINITGRKLIAFPKENVSYQDAKII